MQISRRLWRARQATIACALVWAVLATTGRAQQPAAFVPLEPAQISAPAAPLGTVAGQVIRLPAIESQANGAVTPSSYEQTAAPGVGNQDLLRRLEETERELAALRQLATGGQSGQPLTPVSQLQDPPGSVEDDEDTITRLEALERAAVAANEKLPLIRLSGFMQADQAFVNQSANNRTIFGDVNDGVGLRRVRLQALGNLAEFTRYSIEVDFAVVGRPSFMDVWGEQVNLPFFGAIRIGHFRQPTTMDALTSIRHLEFLERNAVFQALDPFRRMGIMSYRVAEDELSTLAYSIYGTGFTFFNGTNQVYQTLGDTRFATQIGDSGGVSFAIRGTKLLYYDEPAEGAYLFHVGGGYNYSAIGGEGTTGTNAKTFEARTIPEFFQGDLSAGFVTAAGTPVVLDTGRILSHSFNLYHTELAANYGPFHIQNEFIATTLNQFNGPQIFYYGTYVQGGFFLTGEHANYNKQTGVMDYNVKPYNEFFGLGGKGMCGWGAWEVAARWTYLNLSNVGLNPANQLSNAVGPPPSPNAGQLNESTVAVNWWWNQYTRVQFNWIHSMIDNNGRGPSTMNTFASRFQIEF
jgi:phosphate-selective porin OprO/OprP